MFVLTLVIPLGAIFLFDAWLMVEDGAGLKMVVSWVPYFLAASLTVAVVGEGAIRLRRSNDNGGGA